VTGEADLLSTRRNSRSTSSRRGAFSGMQMRAVAQH
jgi:hypothetical protein